MENVTKESLEGMLEENHEQGKYRYKRSMFTDEALFDLEMRHIFEGNWVYLAHESQLAANNDYYSTYIGRQPIFIARNKQGELNAFLNACSHRGAQVCRYKQGNKSTFTCPFHGWTFSNSGKLLKVKDPDGAGYPEQFNCEGSHDLQRVARFESYKGFLFGSLNADVLPLQEHLSDACKIIDMITDQAPDGLEVLKGSSTYVYEGNWKIQAENGADGYHVSAVHWNYVATTNRRKSGQSKNETKAMDASSWSKQAGGFYAFQHGHLLLWTAWANPENRPVFRRYPEFIEKYGKERADWMVAYLRNLCIYPNVYLMDQFGSQIRVWRPLSVNRTEVTIYCIGPKNEDPVERSHRIRQYEDFFNASGMATPDDLEEFRACQSGYSAGAMEWNDVSRGAAHWIAGPDETAQRLGLNPVMSGLKTEDEGLYTVQHRYWVEAMQQALDKDAAAADAPAPTPSLAAPAHELA